MDRPFCKRYYLIDRRRIADLRFFLESYDGLAFVRSLDGKKGIIEVAYPPSRTTDAEELLTALTADLEMTEIDPPEPGKYPAM